MTRGWLRRLWCRATFRHRGRIGSDDVGIHWVCTSCGHTLTILWADATL